MAELTSERVDAVMDIILRFFNADTGALPWYSLMHVVVIVLLLLVIALTGMILVLLLTVIV